MLVFVHAFVEWGWPFTRLTDGHTHREGRQCTYYEPVPVAGDASALTVGGGAVPLRAIEVRGSAAAGASARVRVSGVLLVHARVATAGAAVVCLRSGAVRGPASGLVEAALTRGAVVRITTAHRILCTCAVCEIALGTTRVVMSLSV